jgi:hypothetical protein
MRAAGVMCNTGGSARNHLIGLVRAHQCGDTRTLVSSPSCLKEEVTGPASDGRLLELSSHITTADAEALFACHSDDGWETLPPSVRGASFGDRDRRLTQAAASALADSEGSDGIALVTDDEDFLDNLYEHGLDLGVLPVASTIMMLELWDCGAIGVDALEAVVEAEDEHLSRTPSMSARKRERKQASIDRLISRLGVATAPRPEGD